MSRFLAAAVASATAALCALLAAFLAWNHPLSPTLALLGCAALAVVAFKAPLRWAWAIFPLLPVAGFMSWTGWLAVEEFDLVVLGVAAGGHARLAWAPLSGAPALRRLPGTWRWLLLLAAVTAFAAVQGVLDAGGDDFGWWQGYRDPSNSLRLAKGLAAALLLLPLMRAAWRVDQASASWRLEQAMAGMLATTGLLVLWERLVFTGLLDVSREYRSSGLFWEGHVGGAALAAVLVVGMPFAAAALARATSLRAAAAPLLGLLLGGYACAVSFSPLVYAVVPLVLLLWWLLPLGPAAGAWHGRRARAGEAGAGHALRHAAAGPGAAGTTTAAAPGLRSGLLLLLLQGALAVWLYPGAGWPAVLVLLAALVLALPLQGLAGVLPRLPIVLALLAGVVPAVGLAALVYARPGGVWLWLSAGCISLWLIGVVLLALARRHGQPRWALASVGCAVALLGAVPAVAWLRSGAGALTHAALAAELAAALLLWATLCRRAPWPLWLLPPARLAGWLGALLMTTLLAPIIALLLGMGSGMGGAAVWEARLAAWQARAEAQQLHWSRSLALLEDESDWLLGHGLGRYPARLAAADANDLIVRAAAGGPARAPAGEIRWQREADGRPVLVFTSGLSPAAVGSAEPPAGAATDVPVTDLRVAQRVPAPKPGADGRVATLRLVLRNDEPFVLLADVCARHLHQTRDCASVYRELPSSPAGAWQQVELPLRGAVPSGGRWYAPQPVTFSLALDTPGRRVHIDSVSLLDGSGRELLGNRGFEQGLAYWYFTSEQQHRPWHAGNLAVHLLVEQGLLGLLTWVGLIGLALWRLLLGAARERSLAPPLAAALVGLLLVGLVDSVLDMPRVAFLLSWLVALGLALPGGRRLPGPSRPPAPLVPKERDDVMLSRL